MTRIKLLAVDLDGTVIDSAPDLAYCVDAAMSAAGLPPPGEARVRTWIGDGIERLLERALGDALGGHSDASLLRRNLAAFDACYRKRLFVDSRLYPGVAETLDHCRASGMRLCCITNKRVRFAESLLDEAGLLARFDLVLGGDSLAGKKPEPVQLTAAADRFDVAPDAAVLVGDSHHDYHAARRAGFAFVWARYGYCPAIDAHPEPASISAFPELIDRIEALGCD